MRLAPTVLSPQEEELRDEIREFLESEVRTGSFEPGLGIFADAAPEFSRRLARRGFAGMTVPAEYGGAARSIVERFVVMEELLAVGAPIGAHWTADRQIAPQILAFGSDYLRKRFLPGIAQGECYFCLGFSEPDSGSDLASVRTRAVEAAGGWNLTGRKVWVSRAHTAQFITVLCRTSDEVTDKHIGLSQMIVPLDSPGIEVLPIPMLDGSHHFNEVTFDNVFVPDNMVLGAAGDGWKLATSELTYERAGPDRYMSIFPLLAALVDEDRGASTIGAGEILGRLFGRLWSLRQLSLTIARLLDEGESPAVESALVKDLGTRFEQEFVEALRQLAGLPLRTGVGSPFESLLARSVLYAPSYTIRGGTTEILRGIAAKGILNEWA